jgi:hypothetical protein
MIDLTTPMGAIFSLDGKHRYALWRMWSQTRKPLMFIGLNPSTATSITNDPTITRCMARASNDGFGGLLVANLFAIVSSDPSILLNNSEAIGNETDEYLRQLIGLAGKVFCGWGSFPAAKIRSQEVLKLIPEPYCLGVNAGGQPKHPLYVSYAVPFQKLNLEKHNGR